MQLNKIINKIFKFIYWTLLISELPVIFLFALFYRNSKKNKLIFGTTPIISNKYWANALRYAGYDVLTLMSTYYSINKKEDYDTYFDDLVPKFLRVEKVRYILKPLFVWKYILRNARVVHLSFDGVIYNGLPFLWRLEPYILKLAGVKTVLMPYGSDAYIYSQIPDSSLRHAILSSYPQYARNEEFIRKRLFKWIKNADVIISGIMMDGTGRWDVCMPSFLTIDSKQWKPKMQYSDNDGINGSVKIMHTPNHRGFKGTEFLVAAVKELKSEGLDIELILLEKVSNDLVKEKMQEADILAEQFILGYALSAIEGMASGLPVLSNLSVEFYTRVFRRYSFLNECPILSATPETLKDNLRILVKNPEIRKELGTAGRKYVEKYHSYEAAKYMFESIYSKLNGEDIDLINLFHPLKSAYNASKPFIKHCLVENKISSGDDKIKQGQI